MKKLQLFGLVYLTATVFFVWGCLFVKYKWFPYTYVQPVWKDLAAFIEGDPNEPITSPIQKMLSDWGGVPYRYVQHKKDTYNPPSDATPFEITQDGLMIKGYYKESKVPKGYILMFGAFDFPIAKNQGAVLISTQGSYEGVWAFGEVNYVNPSVDYQRKLIMPTGKFNLPWGCNIKDLGREIPVKSVYEKSHHSIAIAPDGTYWIHIWASVVQLDPDQLDEKGQYKIIRQITLDDDLLEANPEISPVSTRFKLGWDMDKDPQKTHPIRTDLEDPFHNNDVEPFVDPRFPTSEGYALLISIREQNLILVVDPVNAEILWYRQGLTERQHDPDPYGDGVYVYNNAPFRGYSSIDYIPFESGDLPQFGRQTIIDGRDFDWFDPSRGQHIVFDYEGQMHHLVVNDRGGRLMMFDKEGSQIFETINYLGSSENLSTRLQIWSAVYITQEQFDRLMEGCSVN